MAGLGHNNWMCWWVAPTFPLTEIGLRKVLKYLPKEAIKDINRSRLCITLINNSTLWFKSADNPDTLRGEGINFLIMDEAAMMKQDAWQYALRPALMDTGGRVIMISTPKGMNFFREEFIKGQDKLEPEYESFQYSSLVNTYISKDEFEKAKKEMPERVYRQEILAEFIEDIGAVFKKVRECIKGQCEDPRGSVIQNYYMGVDLAKLEDFTVICVLNQNGHLVHFERFNQIDWNFQKAKIINTTERYHNAQVLIDSTGIGDPIYEDLQRKGLRIQGYKFTNESKKQLIENLAIKMENQEITFPEIPELINELREFGYTKSKLSDAIKYQAPEGLHDDCVIALALAVWNYKKKGSRPYIA